MRNDHRVQYEGKLEGEEHRSDATTSRRQPNEMVAPPRNGRAEGAYPARTPCRPHKVADNGLARTPPMGWNSWNKFAGRVDDERSAAWPTRWPQTA